MGTNRLAGAASAYLRSAAHQPVEWHPWEADAFARAAAEDKPVLLDIGAVWCHWCHVMDAESYEDPALAELLNREFVCVKVDRDERPDVDARYQRAVQAIARQGGWPLTGFLTPDAQLFHGGTYFPPESAPGRPSFREMLERVLAVWRGERGRVRAQAEALRDALAGNLDEAAPGGISDLVLADATHGILATADRHHGRLGSRPKFPHPATVEFLLHRWCDAPEPTLRAVIHETLDGMANGGFRDLLGGGFHRYSVDERWVIPHFEKMASDNAELLRVYAGAAALFGRPGWKAVARETVRWVREVLADPGADDDDDYFTWTREELAALLGPYELAIALARFGIGSLGRMPHDPARNVLFAAATAATLAERFGRTQGEMERLLEGVDDRLRAARARRTAPFVDRTRYAGWNAMLAGALLRAAPVLEDSWARDAGLAALSRIRREQREPDLVAHAPGGVAGLLDDPVQCAAAAH